MPRLNDSVKICGHNNALCLTGIETTLQFQNDEEMSCTCLPGCHDIRYSTKVSNVPLVRKSYFVRNTSFSNTAILRVFYTNSFFQSMKKTEVFGYLEFICEFIFIIL